MKKIFTVTLVVVFSSVLLSVTAWGQAKPTVEERLIRVEEGVKNLDKRFDDVNKRFDDLNKRIDDLRSDVVGLRQEMKDLQGNLQNLMLWGFGVTFAGMFALIGFVIWDRRTAIAPVARTTKELEEREEKIVAVLREYARGNKQLLEIMKRIGIL